MKYWWVNQNQTFTQEVDGGYLWSPKTKSNGDKNVFYDNMTKVAPGDIVFSFYKTKLPCIGIITSHGYNQVKPEFGTSGAAWGTEGWMVNVDYRRVKNVITPKKHMGVIGPLLPSKYSPLQQNGNGNPGVYLAELPVALGERLLGIVGDERKGIFKDARNVRGIVLSDKEAEANRIESLIRKDLKMEDTETEAIVKARKGQGQFRKDVISLHGSCPFTGISNPNLLKARHIKPWAKCKTHEERLDPYNGLALSPTADHLFDNGYISFDKEGDAIFSSSLAEDEFNALGIDSGKGFYRLLSLNERVLHYTEFHRKHVFKS